MRIWFDELDLNYANRKSQDCLVGLLGIELVEAGPDFLRATMPVNFKTRQPAGVVHGGASVTLAETVATWAATFVVDREKFHCVGMEINANHIRPASDGLLTAVARPEHLGRTTQVWSVRITDENDKLICLSRTTIAVIAVPSQY